MRWGWVVYGFEGGFWLDGFEGMWIGFCRGWVGGVWIGFCRGWVGGLCIGFCRGCVGGVWIGFCRGWVEGVWIGICRGWVGGLWIGFCRGCVKGVWIGFCRGWVGGVWIGGEVRLSDWNELKQWRKLTVGGSILALRTVGGAWTSVRERIGYIWREGEGGAQSNWAWRVPTLSL